MYIIILTILIIILFYLFNNLLSFIENFKNNNGILFFCQGWTDMFNSLSLINYYSKRYTKLYVVIRKNSYELFNFYIKNFNNIILITFDSDIYCKKLVCNDDLIYNHLKEKYKDLFNSEYLFHGWSDKYRTDKYKDIFSKNMKIDGSNFVNLFYTSYDLKSNIRIDYFIFNRDYDLENSTYNSFINENGEKYILYHSNHNNIDFIKNQMPYNYVNLNKRTNIFFDYIKILENSIEIHLIDSSWAAFIYLLECKYDLFKNKKIYLYSIRNYTKMFQDPILLDNWIFIT